jgi:hypothetical protein
VKFGHSKSTTSNAVDATIPADGVIRKLLVHLPPHEHELVLFDVNRQAASYALFATDPHDTVEALSSVAHAFDLRRVTNRNPETMALMERRRAQGGEVVNERMLEMAWPDGIFSLSHVALPFPPDAPVYGLARQQDRRLPALGQIDLRGETGVLQIPESQLLRLRYNPFYDYLLERIIQRFLPVDSMQP